MIKADLSGVFGFVPENALGLEENRKLLDALYAGETGLDGTGWMKLPGGYDARFSGKLKDTALKISGDSEVLVVIGIGGSYLGARAALDWLKSPVYNQMRKSTPDIYFVGNTVSGEYLEQVLSLIGGRDFSVNYISKSGSTLEPSASFRVLKNLLTAKYGTNGAKSRIYITTDRAKGKLRALADREGYASFIIPSDVGGRYSMLTPVGLLPCACAGIDIDAMMEGARDLLETGKEEALLYASARQALYALGQKIEILASFEPSFRYTGEWWKQLFGESEGKDGKGIFPAYTEFTTDLHSLGQYIQSGERTIFETFVSVEKPRSSIRVPSDAGLEDGLEPIAGRPFTDLNAAALKAVKAAHIDGGVPVAELSLPDTSAYSFGTLIQFFELSCAVSALVMKVNPFDQPGVEAYKKNLFAILGLKK